MSGGILPLTDESLQLLELKNPDAKDTSQQRLEECIQLCMVILTKN